MNVDSQIAAIIAREGDYSNRSADRGGPTRWGITFATARAHGYTGDMKALPQATAAAIYKADYWLAPHLDMVATPAPAVAAKLFDIGVNCGPATGVMMLQRALNALQGTALKVDGVITLGGATLTGLRTYLGARPGNDDEMVLVELIACFQGERYAEIVERDATQRANLFGWIRARVSFGLNLTATGSLA